MQEHPYRPLPARHFWRASVGNAGATGLAGGGFDPVGELPFRIGPQDRVAAAGSCFAQHIARNLAGAGFNFLQTEAGDGEGPFSARFGNIYTARQLRQLLLRAYGLVRPRDAAWRLPSGRYIDPFRPQMLGEGGLGLASAGAVIDAREAHFAAVREMFETCTVFIFTLGLTEAWLTEDGMALPVPPGVLGVTEGASAASFHNFGLSEIYQDLEEVLADICIVNPQLRVIFTVSPVALAATFEPRHVMISNTLSKATLRLAAEMMRERHARVCYFPSYEIVTAPVNAPGAFEADLRSVSPLGVAQVMALFNRHMLSGGEAAAAAPAAMPAPSLNATASPLSDEERAAYDARARIICEEDLLATGPGP
jgi:hypothetical protein